MEQPGGQLSQPARNEAPSSPGVHGPVTDTAAEVVTVPILSLRAGYSPRLNGEDKAHIARLAETEAPLPPILVHKPTMKVIDGMHRLMAASSQGRETIDVIFFEGSEADIFLRAVQANVTHGLPLSQADRRSAAERIIASHPHMSDRTIGEAAGLAAKTVAAIRRRSTRDVPQLNARVGKDGKIRPLDSGEGRRRAAELLTNQPEASLRDIAQSAGISPATVLDVRKRLQRGEPPVPAKPGAARDGATVGSGEVRAAGNGASALAPQASSRPSAQSAAPLAADITVEKLLRDPSLRNNERTKGMLRLLHVNAVGTKQLSNVIMAVPPHRLGIVAQLASQYATMWQDFARELDSRRRITDPPTASR